MISVLLQTFFKNYCMKWIKSMLCIFFLVATLGCSKNKSADQDESGTKFQAPQWRADTTGKYPATMTAVFVLPAALAGNLTANDQLAAFINGECRGVAALEKLSDVNLFFIMIRGLPDESSSVKFKYYSSKTSYMYESNDAINFLIDAIYGTAQNPKTLELSQLK
jgi:hypothetical protein